MKELLQQYASYHVWAGMRLIEFINTLPEGFTTKEVASSFASLSKTLQHMRDAEITWWHRFQIVSAVKVPEKEKISYTEIIEGLQLQAQLWKEYVDQSDEKDLLKTLSYKSMKGDSFETPVFQILMHLFNHGTYHRGQLVTIMHQLGVTGIPQTDFIVWTRL